MPRSNDKASHVVMLILWRQHRLSIKASDPFKPTPNFSKHKQPPHPTNSNHHQICSPKPEKKKKSHHVFHHQKLIHHTIEINHLLRPWKHLTYQQSRTPPAKHSKQKSLPLTHDTVRPTTHSMTLQHHCTIESKVDTITFA